VSGRTVTTPAGETWRVRRLWVPRMRGETLWSRAWRRIRPTGRRVIEATDAGPYRHTWRVVGWRASGEKVDEIADLLAHGHPLPAGHDTGLRPGHEAPEDAGS